MALSGSPPRSLFPLFSGFRCALRWERLLLLDVAPLCGPFPFGPVDKRFPGEPDPLSAVITTFLINRLMVGQGFLGSRYFGKTDYFLFLPCPIGELPKLVPHRFPFVFLSLFPPFGRSAKVEPPLTVTAVIWIRPPVFCSLLLGILKGYCFPLARSLLTPYGSELRTSVGGPPLRALFWTPPFFSKSLSSMTPAHRLSFFHFSRLD